MKDWRNGFPSGLFIGAFGIVPLILWLAEMRVMFRCPNCDSVVTLQKENQQIAPRVLGDSTEGPRIRTDRDSSETSNLAIATPRLSDGFLSQPTSAERDTLNGPQSAAFLGNCYSRTRNSMSNTGRSSTRCFSVSWHRMIFSFLSWSVKRTLI